MDFSHGGGGGGGGRGRDSSNTPTFISPSSSSSSPIRWGPPPLPLSTSSETPCTAPTTTTDLNSPSSSSQPHIEKEHMFDKVVTPSDVGKLNRLVIPKQHAEKFFPLDTAANDNKGLLLNFEDRTGKPWRFRYSYWNSSQSYVITKGWSRFVKEKRLDAGDTVSFGRGTGSNKDRLFIDWRRRPENLHDRQLARMNPLPLAPNYPMVSFAQNTSVGPWSPAGRLFVPPPAVYGYNAGGTGGAGQYLVFTSPQTVASLPNFMSSSGSNNNAAAVGDETVVVPGSPVASSSQAAAKKFRLFGVNLDLPESEEGEGDAVSIRSQDSGASSSSTSPSRSPRGKEPSLDLEM